MKFLEALFPEQASTMAGRVDALFYFLCALSLVVGFSIVGVIAIFVVRYRRRAEDPAGIRKVGIDHDEMRRMEYLWIGAPLIVFLAIFYWAATLFASISTPPADAQQVFVVGKQWMWKVQHLQGRREINALHVPLGQSIKLTMTSEDVIHSFYVPAFRVKADVLPGRYTTLWFEATKVGEFHLFCAEYCGTKHSEMTGKIVVMEPKDFQAWLAGGAASSLSEAGEELFNQLGCQTCHSEDQKGRGPVLRGLFGSKVRLVGGVTVKVDETYLRESIMEPKNKVVAGYQPVMPTYAAQLDEEKIIQLIAYIKSLEKKASVDESTIEQPADAGHGGAGGIGGAALLGGAGGAAGGAFGGGGGR